MKTPAFTVIWEFRVRPGQNGSFTAAYGQDGAWVRLFRQSPSYLGTDLWRDLQDGTRYLTLDRWESSEAYDRFRKSHAAEYNAIDKACESLTTGEKEIGRFMDVRSQG
jgi:heme-degrading monooxygenase HmoA